jgi:hypothetical protein
MSAFAFVTLKPNPVDRLPEDWEARGEFCAATEPFEVGNARMSIADQIAVLEELADIAPEEVAHALGHIVEGLEVGGDTAPDDPDMLLVGEFIETRCGTNLPGI